MSRTFKISGTLIVIITTELVLGTYDSDICCEYLPKILAKARRNSMAELSTPAKLKS
jgi:hypothetical protein